MKILGLGTASYHDASAALVVDGEVVAAAEEERFTRLKHALHQKPIHSARFCLERAGLRPTDLDRIAIPWSEAPYRRLKGQFIRRNLLRRPGKALGNLLRTPRVIEKRRCWVRETLEELGIDPGLPVDWVEHHHAHASSSFHFCGWNDAAILTLDGLGERTTLLLAEGRGRKILPIHEVVSPDSLGIFYGALTDYLGFRHLDGEYKMMGMAAYGDPHRVDLSSLLQVRRGEPRLNLKYIYGPPRRRVGETYYNRALEELWGPPRTGDALVEPHVHIAAAGQALLERVVLELVDTHLRPVLERTRRLCVAGGVALNVQLNRRLREHPLVDELYVQPAASDGGLSLGAAAHASEALSIPCAPFEHAALGPEFSEREIATALEVRGLEGRRVDDIALEAATRLARGEVVAWFQGRMEWGPRALGQRSILGNPAHPGVSDRINEQIKFRETWRPFCPAILEERLAEIVGSDHPSPFMNQAFEVSPAWRDRIREAVHEDGTVRPQGVSRRHSPEFHRLISLFEERTGLPVLLNTSLNRRGEPMACTPSDAIETFLGSGLEVLALGPFLVEKPPGSARHA